MAARKSRNLVNKAELKNLLYSIDIYVYFMFFIFCKKKPPDRNPAGAGQPLMADPVMI